MKIFAFSGRNISVIKRTASKLTDSLNFKKMTKRFDYFFVGRKRTFAFEWNINQNINHISHTSASRARKDHKMG